MDNVFKKAEEDISSFESKGYSSSSHKKGRYHPYERQEKHRVASQTSRLGRT